MYELFEKEATLTNQQGLHVRPARLFVELATRFESDIEVHAKGVRVNGKSIMGLLGLLAQRGSVLTIHAEGPDAHEAVNALTALVARGFDEEPE